VALEEILLTGLDVLPLGLVAAEVVAVAAVVQPLVLDKGVVAAVVA
jgi:hypothetical protein